MMTIITSNIGGEEITLYEEHDRFFMSECIEDEEPHTIRSFDTRDEAISAYRQRIDDYFTASL